MAPRSVYMLKKQGHTVLDIATFSPGRYTLMLAGESDSIG